MRTPILAMLLPVALGACATDPRLTDSDGGQGFGGDVRGKSENDGPAAGGGGVGVGGAGGAGGAGGRLDGGAGSKDGVSDTRRDQSASADRSSTGGCVNNSECPPKQYCAYGFGRCPPDSFACVNHQDVYCNTTGACVPMPTECTDVSRPLCGCDGKTYKNGCLGNLVGVNFGSDHACQP